MTKPIKHVEKAVAVAANTAWFVFDKLNSINRNPSFTPAWSDKPLLKSWEKQKPKLGWPRETDSLCPKCVPDVRKKILDGEVLHGDHVVVDADPLNNRLQFEVAERVSGEPGLTHASQMASAGRTK